MRRARGSSYRLALVLLSLLFAKACGFERPELLAPNPDAGAAGASGVGGGASATSGGAAGSGGSATGGSSGAIGTGGDTETGGNAGDAAEGGAGGATPSCTDFTADLCMKLTWPAAIVPYERGADVDEDRWVYVESALDTWRGIRVLSKTLDFVTGTLNIRPSLVFSAKAGCGIVARSADELTFALGSCISTRDIAREIGVALGLPRMHQRSDRDRFLELAPPSAFDCEKGQFYEKCPGPAEVARFSTQDLMFVPPSYPFPPLECALEPDGNYLYLSRSQENLRESVACEYVLRYLLPIYHHAVAELYATTLGWSPFRLVGMDRGPDRPLETQVAPGWAYIWAPAAVKRESGETRIFMLASDGTESETRGRIALWHIDSEGNGWGDWIKSAWIPSGNSVILPRDGTTAADVVPLVYGEGLYHGTVDGSADVDWTLLEAQPEIELDTLHISELTAARSNTGTLFIYSVWSRPSGADSELRVGETDGTSLSAWEALPLGPLVWSPRAIVTNAGHHLVAVQTSGIAYIEKTDRNWSEWITLLDGEVPLADVAITSSGGRIDVFAATHAYFPLTNLLLRISCDANCTLPGSWSSPVVVGASPDEGSIFGLSLVTSNDGVDLVGRIANQDFYSQGLWHKRWRPLGSEPLE
jgi:hypothetical protein